MIVQKLLERYGKSRQFYWWLCSYAIILLLAIIINLLGYFVTLRVLENEVEKNNLHGLRNISTVCDNHFSEAMNSAYSLLRSSSVEQMGRENLLLYERPLYAEKVLHDINTGVISHKEVEECAVIYRNRDTCIHSAIGRSSLEMAYETCFSEWYDSKEAWLEQVFSVSGSAFVTHTAGNTQNDIFVIYRLPNVNQNLAIMAKINTDQVIQLLRGEDEQKEKGFLIDKEGGVVFSGTEQAGVNHIVLGEVNGGVQKFQGGEYFVSYQDSGVTPFRYVRMISSDVYLKSVKKVRLAFIIGYLLVVVLAGAVAWWFSVINERNKRKLDAELEKQRKYIQEDILKQVMYGRKKLSDAELQEQYPFFNYGTFVVMLFDFLSMESEKENDNFDYSLLCQYISNRFCEVCEMQEVYFCPINEMCAGILTAKDETDIQKLKNAADSICTWFIQEMNLEARCSISRIAEHPEQLHESYEQALEIINQRYLGDQKTVFVYDDIVQEFPSYAYTAESREKIIAMLMTGDFDSVCESVEQLFRGNTGKINLSIQRILVSELVSTIFRAAAQIDMEETLDFRELYRDSMQINNFHRLQAAKETILHYMQKLCQLSLQNSPDNGNSKYNKIAEYITEHYMDPTLNVNMLADIFHINRSWLSKNFREEMGVSLSEYIVKCRIQKAKELLKTDKPVAQIAAEVGFSSEVVYYRAFKKCESITSLQYRKLLQMEGNSEDVMEVPVE